MLYVNLPPEAGHTPYIVARLKKPAYGMNDAPRRWWNILDKALLSHGMVPHTSRSMLLRAVFPYSRVSKVGNTGYKVRSHSRTVQKTPETRERSDMEAAFEKKKRWIP